MANTTNFGWETPDDTDLVKDGASAIRTLGSSVDTTVKNLNPETTLGDISYRSSTANTNTRLALGTAGQVLTVNSGATAPEWATPSSGGMTLISTTTISSQASVTLSSIPTTYKSLYVVLANIKPVSDGDTLRMRFNADSTNNRHYSGAYYSVFYYDTQFTFSANNSTLGGYVSNNTSNSLYTISIPDYTNTTTWKMADIMTFTQATTTPNLTFWRGFGAYNQTSAVTSLFFNFASSEMVSGTIKLYGVS